MLLVSVLQIGVATVLMAIYSWQLTLLVWACFVPLVLVLRPGAAAASTARYTVVRERVGAMLGAISESVVGAETIRAYGVADRVAAAHRRRPSRATRDAQVRAQTLVAVVFSSGVLVSNLVLSAVVVVGTLLGADGGISVGRLLAFLFLVQLFTGPVQMATEILNELQNAVAGWRRVLAVLDTTGRGRRARPGRRGEPARAGADGAARRDLRLPRRARPSCGTSTWTCPPAGRSPSSARPARARRRSPSCSCGFMDPTAGEVLLDGVDLRRIETREPARRVVARAAGGLPLRRDARGQHRLRAARRRARAATRATRRRRRVADAIDALGLCPTGWPSCRRAWRPRSASAGEALSAGERQLVALARAYLAEADLLVLDEATSAVDPATEVRIARALDSLTAGRSTVTIAHRLSTAEAADLVVVVEAGPRRRGRPARRARCTRAGRTPRCTRRG